LPDRALAGKLAELAGLSPLSTAKVSHFIATGKEGAGHEM